MNTKTFILIAVCVIVICFTIIITMKITSDNQLKKSIWSNTPYDAELMNSLLGSFQAAAEEGGAGNSLF